MILFTSMTIREASIEFSIHLNSNKRIFHLLIGIVITQLRANTQTQIPIDDYITIQIGTDTFQGNKFLLIIIYLYYY